MALLIIICDVTQWNVLLSISQDILNKGWDPKNSILGQTSKFDAVKSMLRYKCIVFNTKNRKD